MAKKVIEVVAESDVDLDGYTLDEAIERLIAWRDYHGGSAKFDKNYDYESTSIDLKIQREETDFEYQGRLFREEASQRAQEQRERKILEELQKKYVNV